jgi:hypothetical protein
MKSMNDGSSYSPPKKMPINQSQNSLPVFASFCEPSPFMALFPYRPQNPVVKTIWIVFHAMFLIWTCFTVALVGLVLLPLRFFNIRLYQILESQMWRIGAKVALLVCNIYGDIKFQISGDGYSPQEGLK